MLAPTLESLPLPEHPLEGAREPFWYSMYGLRVRSDVRLPLAPERTGEGAAPDLVFRRAEPGESVPEPDGPLTARILCDHGNIATAIYRGPGGTWLWNRSIATCHLAPNAHHVDVYPHPESDPSAIGLILAGQVPIILLNQLGYAVLHASAVLTERGLVAFLGSSGQGKTTMAAGLLRRGATLLTDDALPLTSAPDGINALPGPAMMKVWRQTADHALGLRDELPDLVPGYSKKLLSLDHRTAFARAPVPVAAIYLLERYDAAATPDDVVSIRRLRGGEGLATLLGHTSHKELLRPADVARALPLYARLVTQAGVRVLRYPTGFEHQTTVHARIIADLEAR